MEMLLGRDVYRMIRILFILNIGGFFMFISIFYLNDFFNFLLLNKL